jgi:hypothetical protein
MKYTFALAVFVATLALVAARAPLLNIGLPNNVPNQ